MATITFRTDDDVDRALAELGGDQRDRSQVIRDAILTAWRRKQAEQLRAEAESLAADADDRAEAQSVLRDMESVRAW